MLIQTVDMIYSFGLVRKVSWFDRDISIRYKITWPLLYKHFFLNNSLKKIPEDKFVNNFLKKSFVQLF